MSEIKPGDRIQPDSTVAAGVTNMRVAMADPATRWWWVGAAYDPPGPRSWQRLRVMSPTRGISSGAQCPSLRPGRMGHIWAEAT